MSNKTLIWSLGGEGPAAEPRRRPFDVIHVPDAKSHDRLAVWDSWPAIDQDGNLWSDDDGRERWFALAAPLREDPEARHSEARITLFARDGSDFRPIGPVFPDDLTDGSREWSGSAVVRGNELVLRFTAAGHRGETEPSAAQRLFESRAGLNGRGVSGWSRPVQLFAADGEIYHPVDCGALVPGGVKGFRDPDIHVDGRGREWLMFTGSSAACPGDHDGVIGLAKRNGAGWEACRPLVDGCGVNRELERPHIRVFGGRLYLFWCTHRDSFAARYRGWPTGLYGAVADEIEGRWRPANGDGLIAGNPEESPSQAYGWWVLPDGRVTGFVDRPGDGSRFVGGWAPEQQLRIDGDHVVLA